jgi:hypothetical protein
MFTRRAALMGAAVVAAAPYVIKTATAQETAANVGAAPADLSSLTRRKVKLVAPPYVHAHEQVATTGPEIVEFEMKIVEKEIQVDEDAWLQAFTFNGSTPGPLMVVHEGDYVEPRRKDGAAVQGHQAGGICLSLRARWPDDPVACGVGNVGLHHGVAARRAEGRSRPACQL